jgi:hypothetical protein
MPTTTTEPTEMSAPPTTRQLADLRRLAEQTGTSFTPPASKADASAAIQAMSRRPKTPTDERRRETEDVRAVMATGRGDHAEYQPGEITGYGSGCTWAQRSTTHAAGCATTTRVPAVELGRYRTSDGERRLVGVRVDGMPRVIDAPATGRGRRYIIERGEDLDCDGRRALQALIAEYIAQSELRDRPAILLDPDASDAM